MRIDDCIRQLESGGAAIIALLENIDAAQEAWRPAPERWSLLEVACHLLDEEREDFRRRLDLILHAPDEEWPPIDPEGWVRSREYASRDLAATLRELAAERARSIAWLGTLGDPDWQSAHHHPRFGSMKAGEMMAAWIDHDLLHLRQIIRLKHEYLSVIAPYGSGYAGEW